MKLVVFDCDGTLIDSAACILEVLRKSFIACDLPPPEEKKLRYKIGLPLHDILSDFLPKETRVTHPGIEKKLLKNYEDILASTQFDKKQEGTLFPDIKTMLDKLREEGVLLSIATGRSHRSLVKALRHHNLQDYFICLRSADDGPSKPNPSILLDILQETGVDKNNAVMIGDTIFDMNMADNAGVGGIAVDWGYHDRQTLNICNIYSIVTEPLDLPETINRFWQSILTIDSGKN